MMMMIQQLFEMETLPSTLAVVALLVYLAGRYRTSICGEENTTCNDFLKNADIMAMVSSGCAAVLVLCICLGFVTLSGGAGGLGGGYGGGYGGYGGF